MKTSLLYKNEYVNTVLSFIYRHKPISGIADSTSSGKTAANVDSDNSDSEGSDQDISTRANSNDKTTASSSSREPRPMEDTRTLKKVFVFGNSVVKIELVEVARQN